MRARIVRPATRAAIALVGLVGLVACSSGAAAPQQTRTSELSFAFPVQDQPTLAGFSDAVFVAEVQKKVGQKPLTEGVPAGQFRVRVIETLKGEVPATVTVTQEGGVEDSGDMLLVEGDPILQEGDTYLFAGRFDTRSGALVVVPRYGDIPLDTSSAAVETRVQSAQHPKVRQMKQSVAQQKKVPRLEAPATSGAG